MIRATNLSMIAMFLAACWLRCLAPNTALAEETVHIGSKAFTESVILGEMLTSIAGCKQIQGDRTFRVKHMAELGGTQILWKSLLNGEIDAYVEYSGTLQHEILSGRSAETLSQIVAAVGKDGVRATGPLGFNNTYALGMRKARATELKIKSISDLKNHPELELGFSDEFIERSDGWSGIRERYTMPDFKVRGLDHSLAYRGLGNGSIDVIDLYSTDPEIITYDLQILEDDLGHFPKYEAIIVYRADLEERYPNLITAFKQFEGKIDSDTMAKMNADSRVRRIPENKIANSFIHTAIDKDLILAEVSDSRWRRRLSSLSKNTLQHLLLVVVSLAAAIAVALPLGVYSYKQPRLGRWILGIVGVIQTIPSMALLVFMIPLLGLGPLPAIVALFLYSLLPIVRGTYTGLCSLPESIHESALALGLPDLARLKLIEMPMASQQILAGIKTSAVINVGTATIGALIGAGGLGQPILTGIRLADIGLILQGAVPAALLALAAQSLFGWLERFFVPAGLRLSAKR